MSRDCPPVVEALSEVLLHDIEGVPAYLGHVQIKPRGSSIVVDGLPEVYLPWMRFVERCTADELPLSVSTAFQELTWRAAYYRLATGDQLAAVASGMVQAINNTSINRDQSIWYRDPSFFRLRSAYLGLRDSLHRLEVFSAGQISQWPIAARIAFVSHLYEQAMQNGAVVTAIDTDAISPSYAADLPSIDSHLTVVGDRRQMHISDPAHFPWFVDPFPVSSAAAMTNSQELFEHWENHYQAIRIERLENIDDIARSVGLGFLCEPGSRLPSIIEHYAGATGLLNQSIGLVSMQKKSTTSTSSW